VTEDYHDQKYFYPFILRPDSERSEGQIYARKSNGGIACELVERVDGLAVYLPVINWSTNREMDVGEDTHVVESRATAIPAIAPNRRYLLAK
jgi:hypothetical protein